VKFTIGGAEYDLTREQVEARLVNVEPESLRQVFVLVNERRFPVKQALAVGAGIVRSGFTTQDAIRILRKLGFTVGELPVTFELRTRVLPGFPDFWDTVAEKYPRALAAMPEILPLANEIFAIPMKEPVHKICRMLSKNIFTSCSALQLLCVNGFGVDAMRVARSMFEGAVSVAYLREHPDESDDFIDFYWIRKKRLQDYIEQYEPETTKGVPLKLRQRVLHEYARVLPRFQDKNGRVRGRWSKKSFPQLAKEVGVFGLYRTFYDTTSSMHHMDIAGVISQMEDSKDTLVCDADVAPSMRWIDDALIAGHTAVVLSLTNYIDLTGVGRPDVKDKLQKGLEAAWPVEAAAVKAKASA
jgi:hypothetical protein